MFFSVTLYLAYSRVGRTPHCTPNFWERWNSTLHFWLLPKVGNLINLFHRMGIEPTIIVLRDRNHNDGFYNKIYLPGYASINLSINLLETRSKNPFKNCISVFTLVK